MDQTEALVVGGGPAGLAAAIVLAEAGISTVLAEKKTFPVDKVCGEGLMPPGVAHLRALGIEPDQGTPLSGIRYHAGPHLSAAATFAQGPGLGLRRTVLSAALYRRALGLRTLDLRPRTVARPLARQGNQVVVSVGAGRMRTRLLVGADGLNSGVRRWAGLDGGPARWQRWGARRHYRLPPWSEFVEVYWSREGVEAYITPTGPQEVGVAFLWHKDRYHSLRGGAGLFPSLLTPFPQLRARLAHAAPLDDVAAVGPLHRPVRDVIAGHTLLLGDAAGYVDALTGEGVSLALAQALSLRQTILPALRGAQPLPLALRRFRRRHRALLRPYTCSTRLLLFLSSHPMLVDPVLRILKRWPALFRLALSASMGTL